MRDNVRKITVTDKRTQKRKRDFSRKVILFQRRKEALREEDDEDDPLSGKTSKPNGRRTFPFKNRSDDLAPEVLVLEDGLVI